MAPNRSIDIDFLRGLSVIWVVSFHATFFTQLSWPQFALPFVRNSNGYYGVVVFFVISGFLISSTIIARVGALARVDLSDFYVMRAARIMPPLLLFIATMLTLHFWGIEQFTLPVSRNPIEPAWYAITFRYNAYYWMHSDQGDLAWRPLWSLAIEEWFYIIYPVLCITLRRYILIIPILICIVIYGPIARLDGEAATYFLGGTADTIAIGCLTALLISWWKWPINNFVCWIIRLSGLCIIVGGAMYAPFKGNIVIGPSIVAIGASVYLFSAQVPKKLHYACRIWPRLYPVRLICLFGKRSYEIYLFHTAVIMAMAPMLVPSNALSNIACHASLLAVLLLLGTVIGVLYSDPLNIMLRRILFRRSLRSNRIEASNSNP